MPHGLNPLRRSIVHQNAKLDFVLRLRLDRAFDRSAPLLLVFRMHSLKALFPGWLSLFRIESIDSLPLVGKVQSGFSRDLPDPAACAAKPLRFRQICFAASERLLCRLALGDVHAGPVPPDNPAITIEQRNFAVEHPAEVPVCKADTRFKLENITGSERGAPFGHNAPDVIGMNESGPLPSSHFVKRDTKVLEPSFVEVVEAAVGLGGMN